MSVSPSDRPIPIPWPVRFRMLREQVAPLFVFMVSIVAIYYLWINHARPVDIVGEVHRERAAVASLEGGTVLQIHVEPYTHVHKNDLIATIATTDPSILEARLAVIRAEIHLLTATMDPLVARRRADIDYQGLQVELLEQRLEKALVDIRLQQAQRDVARMERLFAENLISPAEVEAGRTSMKVLQEEQLRRQTIILSLQTELEHLALPDVERSDAMGAALAVHEQRLTMVEAELRPIMLRASMDGVLGSIEKITGEILMAGEPLTTIMSESSYYILAYMRPPIQTRPAAGMDVRIITDSRESAIGKVLHVSPQLDELPEHFYTPGQRPQRALPIVVSLPEQMNVIPGERVMLSLASR